MSERDIFIAALQFDDATERAAYLDKACGDHANLRQQIERLLRLHDEAGSFLERPGEPQVTGAYPPPEADSAGSPMLEQPGDRIGPYKLLQSLGEGGMGTVWVAEQEKPVKRRVALKLIKAGMDSAQVLRRFEAERQALALMDHTNIAKVLDVGTTPHGRPYFAMELVKGVPITRYCDELHLSLRERLELFVPVCQAIQHAHQKGIIHRDIKPSNVLVAMQDGKPVPKVIDFGVAKALHQRLSERSMYTEIGAVIGTLEYMSPEQAELSTLDIDTRADVYALGVLLYELLTGSTPLDRKRLKQAAFAEMLRIIKEEEPPKPSTRLTDSQDSLASLASQRRTEPARLTKDVRGELDWIVMKCLEKDRTRRYETANGLARDIERHLHNEAVEACPQSAGYRMRTFARKNKKVLATATAFTLLLVVGVVASTWQAVRATRAEARAKHESEAAQANFALARDAVDSYLTSVTDDPDLKRQDFNHLRKRLLETAIPFYQNLLQQKPGDLHQEVEHGRAYSRLGIVRAAIGDREAALADYEKAESVFARLAAAPDGAIHRERLAQAQEATGWALKQLGKQAVAEDKFRNSLRIWQQLAGESPDDGKIKASIAMLHNRLGVVLRESGKTPEAVVEHRLAYEQSQALAAQSPKDAGLQMALAYQCYVLAQSLTQLGKAADALPVAHEAVAIRKKLLDEVPEDPGRLFDLASATGELASVLEVLHRDAEAESEFRRAIDLQLNLVRRFPSIPDHRLNAAIGSSNLGRLLNRLLRYDDSAESYRAAITLSDELARDFPKVPDYLQINASAHHNFGLTLQNQNKLAEAEAQYRQALDIRKRLTTEFPNVTSYQLFGIQNLNNLGNLQAAQGNKVGAEISLREALALNRDLANRVGQEPSIREQLGMQVMNLGMQLADADEANALYREGITLFERLVKDFPSIPTYRYDLALSHNNFGTLLKNRGAIADADADAEYRHSIDVSLTLVADYPHEPLFAVQLAGTYGNLGALLHDNGRFEAALDVLDKSIVLLSQIVKDAPTDVGARRFLRNNFGKRAYSYSSLNRHADAARDWHRHMELSEKPFDRKGRLGEAIALAHLDGQHEQARKLAESLAAEKGIDKETLYGMACICAETARDAQLHEPYAVVAVALLRQAAALGFTDGSGLQNDQSFDRLRGRTDFQAVVAEAERRLKEAATNRRP